MTDDQLGHRIKQLLAEKELSEKHAAKEIGVAGSVLNGWCQNAVPRDYKAVKRLADLLGVSLSFLLTGEPEATLNLEELVKGRDVVLDGYYHVSVKKITLKGGK